MKTVKFTFSSSVIQFLKYIIPLVLFTSIVFFTVITIRIHQDTYATLNVKLNSILDTEHEIMAQPLWNINAKRAGQIINAIYSDPDVAGIALYDDNNKLISSAGILDNFPYGQAEVFFAESSSFHGNLNLFSHILSTVLLSNSKNKKIFFHGRRKIFFGTDASKEHVGMLFLVITSANQDVWLRGRLKQDLVLMALILLSIIFSCYYAYWRSTLIPLNKLLKGIFSAKKGTFNKIQGHEGRSEIDIVIQQFNDFQEKQLEHQKYLENEKNILESTVRLRTRELIESQNKYKNLVESTSDWIWEVDENAVYTYVSPKIFDILGYSPDEVIGKTPFDFMPPGEAERIAETFAQIVNEWKIIISLENTNLHKDGRLVVLETTGVPVFDSEGIFRGYRGIDRNISDRKQAEKEKEKLESQLRQAYKMEAIGTMAGGIAHDFNNILAIILGNAGLARDDIPKGNPAKYNIDKIIDASIRAKDLVKQILTFSRQSDQKLMPLEASSAIEKSLKLLRSTIPTTVSIVHNVCKDCGTIMSDPTQIHQLLMNLFSNAVHAMDEKGTLEVTGENVYLDSDDIVHQPGLEPGQYLKLSVRDTGMGMDKKTQDRIFDPFYTTKEVGEGTGMGLSIVLGIIQSHGGMISVDSEPGKGATFKIYFPIVEKEVIEETDAFEQLPRGNEKILFVDDEKALVEMGSAMLERQGYQVTTKTSSKDALETFKSDPEAFDLVITDQTMPNMSGAELATEIMKISPDIPIILCTGYSKKISEVKAKELGIKEFCLKPLEWKQLTEIVRKVLDGK